MKSLQELQRIARDAMVKYAGDDEIYELAKALEETAEYAERLKEASRERAAA